MVAGRSRKGAYYLTGARQVRLLFWPLAGLVASLPFVLGVARRAPDLPPLALAGVAVLGVALLSLSVPALVLHWRYRRHDAETVVLFNPGGGQLEIRHLTRGTVVVRPAALTAATWTRARARHSFWAQYETLRLETAGSSGPIMLTSLPLDLAPVVAWLRAQRVPVTERTRGLVWG